MIKKLCPILDRISGLPFAPFVIGIYHGYQKACLAEFLQPFVDEYLNLKNNGFSINKQALQINILSMMLLLEHMLLAQNRIMDTLPVENALSEKRINKRLF